jgi:16S rRNA (uracil1498-N3)-methyltransferase
MNVLLFEQSELNSDVFCVDGERARHLIEDLKVELTFKLRIGQIDGYLGWGEVVGVGRETVEVKVCELKEPIAQLPIDLLIAMPRPQILKRVLESSASMGIRKIIITSSERVEKSYLTSKILKESEIRKHLQLGLEQGVGTKFPEVEICSNLQNSLFKAGERKATKIIAHPLGVSSFSDLEPTLFSEEVSTLFAIGPERGWTEAEVAQFIEDGYIPVSMGARQLRVDTAVVAVMSKIILLREGQSRNL